MSFLLQFTLQKLFRKQYGIDDVHREKSFECNDQRWWAFVMYHMVNIPTHFVHQLSNALPAYDVLISIFQFLYFIPTHTYTCRWAPNCHREGADTCIREVDTCTRGGNVKSEGGDGQMCNFQAKTDRHTHTDRGSYRYGTSLNLKDINICKFIESLFKC